MRLFPLLLLVLFTTLSTRARAQEVPPPLERITLGIALPSADSSRALAGLDTLPPSPTEPALPGDTLPTPIVDTSRVLPLNELLPAYAWQETTSGVREGYVLSLEQFGALEEDAGERPARSSRYLLGRWYLEATRPGENAPRRETADTLLIFSFDYHMAARMVDKRYLDRDRSGPYQTDFYVDYAVEVADEERLVLRDLLTGEERTFEAIPLIDGRDAAERRIPKGQDRPAEEGVIFQLPRLPGGGF